ncbi:Phosphomannomutase [hydrothermal vent metagenome]|uniref:Phosphomannomutase n=1 Tax=hydrothermal vent metagenome TaxID=652676 RepID=A0A1W1CDP1_9ZZZZ
MKKLTIEDKSFNLKDIKQLYPAALVKTGDGDETTEMSLEWIDSESKGRVEIVGYGVFIVISDEEKFSFVYKSREELDDCIGVVAKQINRNS